MEVKTEKYMGQGLSGLTALPHCRGFPEHRGPHMFWEEAGRAESLPPELFRVSWPPAPVLLPLGDPHSPASERSRTRWSLSPCTSEETRLREDCGHTHTKDELTRAAVPEMGADLGVPALGISLVLVVWTPATWRMPARCRVGQDLARQAWVRL